MKIREDFDPRQLAKLSERKLQRLVDKSMNSLCPLRVINHRNDRCVQHRPFSSAMLTGRQSLSAMSILGNDHIVRQTDRERLISGLILGIRVGTVKCHGLPIS